MKKNSNVSVVKICIRQRRSASSVPLSVHVVVFFPSLSLLFWDIFLWPVGQSPQRCPATPGGPERKRWRQMRSRMRINKTHSIADGRRRDKTTTRGEIMDESGGKRGRLEYEIMCRLTVLKEKLCKSKSTQLNLPREAQSCFFFCFIKLYGWNFLTGQNRSLLKFT